MYNPLCLRLGDSPQFELDEALSSAHDAVTVWTITTAVCAPFALLCLLACCGLQIKFGCIGSARANTRSAHATSTATGVATITGSELQTVSAAPVEGVAIEDDGRPKVEGAVVGQATAWVADGAPGENQ